jgi:hypothetical protein
VTQLLGAREIEAQEIAMVVAHARHPNSR